MSKVKAITEDGACKPVPVKQVSSLDLGFSELNPLQSRFVLEDLHRKNANIVAAWPTSAGKTVIAELTAEQTLAIGDKVIYACPLKALAEEKIRRFKNLFSDVPIEIFTGDYREVENRKEKAQRARIAIVTTELLDSVTRNPTLSDLLLSRTGLIIIDEAHIIATDRGPTVEAALMAASSINPETRFVLLSATLPNAKEFGTWIARLNRKETYVLESSWRPVEIEWHIIDPEVKNYYRWNTDARFLLKELLPKLTSEGGVLLFVWTLAEGRTLEKYVLKLGYSCAFHNASLPLDERLSLEEAFDQGRVQVLISTTTLAWGRNLSARHVIIWGNRRGPHNVPAWDVLQMGGRAGRTGLAPKGDVWWIVQNIKFAENVLKSPPPITSAFSDPRKLAFHLLGETARNGFHSSTMKVFRSWFSRSFAARTLKEPEKHLASALKILLVTKTMEKFPDGGFKTTVLGKIAARFYFDPLEVYLWHETLKAFLSMYPSLDSFKDPGKVAFLLLSPLRMREDFYITKKEEEYFFERMSLLDMWIGEFKTKVSKGLPGEELPHLFAVLVVLEWYFKVQSGAEGVRPYYKVRDLILDFSRAGTALKEIAKGVFHRPDLAQTLEDMALVLSYGTPPGAAELLRIPGIGTKRARWLLDLGIRTREDLVRAVKEKNPEVLSLLPEPIQMKIIQLSC